MDLQLKDGKNCLLCRQPKALHCGGDYDESACMQTLKKLLVFLEDFRMGFFDRDNFDYMVSVRDGEVVDLGNPRRILRSAPKKARRIVH